MQLRMLKCLLFFFLLRSVLVESKRRLCWLVVILKYSLATNTSAEDFAGIPAAGFVHPSVAKKIIASTCMLAGLRSIQRNDSSENNHNYREGLFLLFFHLLLQWQYIFISISPGKLA